MTNMNELLYLVHCGNRYALMELYGYYFTVLKKIAIKKYKYLPRGIEYDDLAQAGMISLEQVMKNYREDRGSAFNTYVGVCLNRRLSSVISRVRFVADREYAVVSLNDYVNEGRRELGELIADPSPAYQPMDRCQRDDTWERVDELLNDISDRDRLIFEMKRYGYSDPEIAEVLDLPVRIVYNANYRTLKKIRDALSSQNGFD